MTAARLRFQVQLVVVMLQEGRAFISMNCPWVKITCTVGICAVTAWVAWGKNHVPTIVLWHVSSCWSFKSTELNSGCVFVVQHCITRDTLSWLSVCSLGPCECSFAFLSVSRQSLIIRLWKWSSSETSKHSDIFGSNQLTMILFLKEVRPCKSALLHRLEGEFQDVQHLDLTRCKGLRNRNLKNVLKSKAAIKTLMLGPGFPRPLTGLGLYQLSNEVRLLYSWTDIYRGPYLSSKHRLEIRSYIRTQALLSAVLHHHMTFDLPCHFTAACQSVPKSSWCWTGYIDHELCAKAIDCTKHLIKQLKVQRLSSSRGQKTQDLTDVSIWRPQSLDVVPWFTFQCGCVWYKSPTAGGCFLQALMTAAKIKTIRSLSLSWLGSITSTGVRTLCEQMTGLQSLHIIGCSQLVIPAVYSLSRLTALQSFTLQHCTKVCSHFLMIVPSNHDAIAHRSMICASIPRCWIRIALGKLRRSWCGWISLRGNTFQKHGWPVVED